MFYWQMHIVMRNLLTSIGAAINDGKLYWLWKEMGNLFWVQKVKRKRRLRAKAYRVSCAMFAMTICMQHWRKRRWSAKAMQGLKLIAMLMVYGMHDFPILLGKGGGEVISTNYKIHTTSACLRWLLSSILLYILHVVNYIYRSTNKKHIEIDR